VRPRQVPLLCTQKHRTLPVRLRQALFVLLKAQNAARSLGAAHPGPRLDFIRRGRGGKAGGTKLAVLPVSCGFPLARATRKIRVAKFWKFQVSSLLNFHIRRLEVHNLWDLVDLSVAPIDPAFATTAKTLEGLLIFKAVIFAIFAFATFALSSPLKFNILRLEVHKPSASVDLSVPPKICALHTPAKSLQG